MKSCRIFASMLLMIMVFFAQNSVFAQRTVDTPIQGTPVGLEGDPEPIITNFETDAKGQFYFKLEKPPTEKSRKYKLKISYDAIMQNLSKIDPGFTKNKANYVISILLTATRTGVTINGKETPVKLIIDNTTKPISIFDRWGNLTLAGTLTYELRAYKPDNKSER